MNDTCSCGQTSPPETGELAERDGSLREHADYTSIELPGGVQSLEAVLNYRCGEEVNFELPLSE